MVRDLGLSELAPGQSWVRLILKAEDTPQNRAIHDSFREMASIECKDDYTLALAKLLEYYAADAKTEMLYQQLMLLEGRINVLESVASVPKEQDVVNDGTF
jgi:hypothetical protein